MCHQQRLRPACVYLQTDQSLCWSLKYSMTVKQLTKPHQGSKIVLVRSYLRVSQAAGQVNILIFLLKIKFSPCMPINFVMQGKCLFSDISRPAHLRFLSLKVGCTGSFESTLVKMPHCWKTCVTAHL